MDKFPHYTREDIADAQESPRMGIRAMLDKVYNDFYGELEATVCSIMAAGVPLSNIRISSPKVVINDNVMKLQGHIKFYP